MKPRRLDLVVLALGLGVLCTLILSRLPARSSDQALTPAELGEAPPETRVRVRGPVKGDPESATFRLKGAPIPVVLDVNTELHLDRGAAQPTSPEARTEASLRRGDSVLVVGRIEQREGERRLRAAQVWKAGALDPTGTPPQDPVRAHAEVAGLTALIGVLLALVGYVRAPVLLARIRPPATSPRRQTTE